jgi:hypothetical protein
MYAPALFGGWNTLKSVTPGLIGELIGSCALDFEGDGLMSGARVQSLGRAALSIPAGGELDVRDCQFGDKDT